MVLSLQRDLTRGTPDEVTVPTVVVGQAGATLVSISAGTDGFFAIARAFDVVVVVLCES